MRPLLWAEGRLWHKPKEEKSPPPPPQVQLVYTSDGSPHHQTLVANIHGSKLLFVPPVFAAIKGFFSSNDTPSAAAQALPNSSHLSHCEKGPVGSPVLTPFKSGANYIRSRVSASPRTMPAAATIRVRLWLDASELVLPRDVSDLDGEAISLRGALCAKYHDEHGHGELGVAQCLTIACWHASLVECPIAFADQLDVEVIQLQLSVIRASGSATVLAPTSLSAKMSRGPSHLGNKV